MKRLAFKYFPDNWQATIEHLESRGDFPQRAAGRLKIGQMLEAGVVKMFDITFGGRRIGNLDLGNGVLHAPVLWRGIACTFSSVGMTNAPGFEADTAINADSPLSAVFVSLHVTPGEKHPNAVSAETLAQLIERTTTAVSTAEKGTALEELARFVFSGIPGLRVLYSNRYTETEEIDVVVGNGKDSPFPHDQQLILVECKNWSGKCGKNEIVLFRSKLENRRGRSSLGFLISWNGFADTVTKDQLRHSQSATVIALLTGDDIRAMRDREAVGVLEKVYHDAVLD